MQLQEDLGGTGRIYLEGGTPGEDRRLEEGRPGVDMRLVEGNLAEEDTAGRMAAAVRTVEGTVDPHKVAALTARPPKPAMNKQILIEHKTRNEKEMLCTGNCQGTQPRPTHSHRMTTIRQTHDVDFNR